MCQNQNSTVRAEIWYLQGVARGFTEKCNKWDAIKYLGFRKV